MLNQSDNKIRLNTTILHEKSLFFKVYSENVAREIVADLFFFLKKSYMRKMKRSAPKFQGILVVLNLEKLYKSADY